MQASAIGNSFYQSDHAVDDAVLINVESGHDWEVAGNVFRSYSTVAENIGVVVGNLAGYVDIHDNNFETKSIGIWLKTGGTGNNRNRNNTFKGSYSFASIYEEVPNLISHGARSIALYRSAAGSIANGGADVAWDVIGHNDFATFTAGGSAVTIAPGSGVKRVRVTGGCVFGANGTGVRHLQIRKNGNQSYVGAAMTPLVFWRCWVLPLNVSTGVLDIGEGDTISLFAYQNSGGALGLQDSGLTRLNIELVE
ncbi:hypothetical protein F9K77_12425 [Ochrobactrum sp. LMG 5442]|nr:hypothetical protein F9K77_12425 [Ochrobactrum sp. LMG 5442]